MSVHLRPARMRTRAKVEAVLSGVPHFTGQSDAVRAALAYGVRRGLPGYGPVPDLRPSRLAVFWAWLTR